MNQSSQGALTAVAPVMVAGQPPNGEGGSWKTVFQGVRRRLGEILAERLIFVVFLYEGRDIRHP